WFVGLVPLLFVVIGLAIAILGPRATMRQAERGWYAVTGRRAIVYGASMFGSGGQATTYEPEELPRMRGEQGKAPEGAGDLIFKTVVTQPTRTERDARGRTRTSTSTNTQHFGFLGIENVKEVETLIYNVLLGGDDE